MRLTILGGGGFRVPLVYRALLDDRGKGRVTHVTLHDVDASRMAAIGRVLAEQAYGVADAPEVSITTDFDGAVTGTDFIFSAVRIGGLEGRAVDERVALDEGVLGQETVGAGGIAYGLRTVPVARDLARRIAELNPEAWVINFTNPTGMVTEAMSDFLGDRVIGICDSPVGLGRRVAAALGVDPATMWLDYAGLNHLGWLRGVRVDGRDLLPELLRDDRALSSLEEGRLFGAEWLRTIGCIPNEYLHYYYFNREALAAARAAGRTRGALLIEQQRRFYAQQDGSALAAWDRVRREREATYVAQSRGASGVGERASGDLEPGGYDQVALALMRAIALDERTTLILDVRGRGAIGALDPDAVVEVPCFVDANGARPVPVDPLPGHALGLVTTVKAVERAVIEAATTGSRAAALRAFATHPLVDSVTIAGRLLERYERELPQLGYLRSKRARRSSESTEEGGGTRMSHPEDSHRLRAIGHSDLNGYGDGMQVLREGDALYVGHYGTSGMGTSILDASDPTGPRVVEQWPAPQGSHTHKVQVADGLLLVNHERFQGGDPYAAGMAVYSLEDPYQPRPIGYFRSGGMGVHRIVWTGGDFAYVSATPGGFDDRIWVIVDMRDPAWPREAGRWWWPGMWRGGGEAPGWPDHRRYAAHHALIDGDRAFLGYGDAGMVILDVSDVTAPREISHLTWEPGGDTHTCLPLPGRDLLVVTDEEVVEDCAGEEHRIRLVDVSNPATPTVTAVLPAPQGDFCRRGLRFGPHNLHENRPGSYRSAELVFATYFNAGVRVYDVADAREPVELAHWIPEPPPGQQAAMINDIFVGADGLIYTTDRVSGGVYVLEPEPRLASRMRGAQV